MILTVLLTKTKLQGLNLSSILRKLKNTTFIVFYIFLLSSCLNEIEDTQSQKWELIYKNE